MLLFGRRNSKQRTGFYKQITHWTYCFVKKGLIWGFWFSQADKLETRTKSQKLWITSFVTFSIRLDSTLDWNTYRSIVLPRLQYLQWWTVESSIYRYVVNIKIYISQSGRTVDRITEHVGDMDSSRKIQVRIMYNAVYSVHVLSQCLVIKEINISCCAKNTYTKALLCFHCAFPSQKQISALNSCQRSFYRANVPLIGPFCLRFFFNSERYGVFSLTWLCWTFCTSCLTMLGKVPSDWWRSLPLVTTTCLTGGSSWGNVPVPVPVPHFYNNTSYTDVLCLINTEQVMCSTASSVDYTSYLNRGPVFIHYIIFNTHNWSCVVLTVGGEIELYYCTGLNACTKRK